MKNKEATEDGFEDEVGTYFRNKLRREVVTGERVSHKIKRSSISCKVW
jgi:hypothetical protein